MNQELPSGKTFVLITGDVYQELFKAGDQGYIDGYIRGCDDIPMAIVVRISDGYIGFIPLNQLRAN